MTGQAGAHSALADSEIRVTPMAPAQAWQSPGAAAVPGPAALPGEFRLRDGTPAMIWPLLPDDAETLRDLFRRMSPGSRRSRFLQPLSELGDPMITLLVDSVDGVRHTALLLMVLPSQGPEEAAGVARLVQYCEDPAAADIAVTVTDDWQGRGAGTALLTALLQRRPAVITRLCTVVAADNRASLAMLDRIGQMSVGPPDCGVRDVIVDLPAVGQELAGPAGSTSPRARSTGTLTGPRLLPCLAQAGLLPAEGYLRIVRRVAVLNRDLTLGWAGIAVAGSPALRSAIERAQARRVIERAQASRRGSCVRH
ncbi:MAG: N-acetyltransferase family protein [Streptosporangiaceae bacterium]